LARRFSPGSCSSCASWISLMDVFRLHLALEAAEGVSQRLTLLNYKLLPRVFTPSFVLTWTNGFQQGVTGINANRAIVHFFYRRLSSKSRLKLLIKSRSQVYFNFSVNNSREVQCEARLLGKGGSLIDRACGGKRHAARIVVDRRRRSGDDRNQCPSWPTRLEFLLAGGQGERLWP